MLIESDMMEKGMTLLAEKKQIIAAKKTDNKLNFFIISCIFIFLLFLANETSTRIAKLLAPKRE